MNKGHKPLKIQRPEGYVRNKRGNPNWGRPLVDTIFPPTLTKWDYLLKELKLTEYDTPQILRSTKVREFAFRYARSHFVPEYVLKHYDIRVGDFGVLDL